MTDSYLFFGLVATGRSCVRKGAVVPLLQQGATFSGGLRLSQWWHHSATCVALRIAGFTDARRVDPLASQQAARKPPIGESPLTQTPIFGILAG